MTDGYYIVLENDSEYFEEGDIVYVIFKQDKVTVLVDDHTFSYSINDFPQWFEPCVNGHEQRQKQIAQLMVEIDNDIEIDNESTLTSDFDGANSLITATSMPIVKENIAKVRNAIAIKKKELLSKTQKLTNLINEKQRILEAKAQKLNGFISKAEKAIHIINLYLGKHEEIVMLKQGTPAPAETKIHMRQRILHMDEECALEADNGGIDVYSIGDFDKWLTSKPENLEQVLPEKKGIVVFHIKRNQKDYKHESAFVSTQLNDANLHWTYFLIRNGENLYRVQVDVTAGEYLFPTEREYLEIFEKHDYRTNEIEVIKPGSDEYMKAMERADETNRHYFSMMLVVQGIIDRTDIFKPMPVDRINMCNQKEFGEFVHLIYDAENVIDSDHIPFSDWLREINGDLEIGNRIIGNFNYSTIENDRLYPSSADMPPSRVLHTIEEKHGRFLAIRYERDIWTVDGYRRSHTRAKCNLYKTDDFIVNFDAAEVEDIKYFLKSRSNRKYYRNMITILEICLDLKEKELKDEEPFIELLVDRISKKYSEDPEIVKEKIGELVKWWKFKNRQHRALCSDDKKAFIMIVNEYGTRNKQNEIRDKYSQYDELIIDTIKLKHPNVVFIGHKSGNKYVAYVPCNDHNIWVDEQLWTHNRVTNMVYMSDKKESKVVDNRHMKWKELYSTDRWKKWVINPQPNKVLTDHEIDLLLESALPKIKDRLPLYAYCDNDFNIYLMSFDKNERNEIDSDYHDLTTTHDKVPWVKKSSVKLDWSWQSREQFQCIYDGKKRYERQYRQVNRYIREWPENLEIVDGILLAHKKHLKESRARDARICRIARSIVTHVVERKTRDAQLEYFAEFGAPELWEDHLEKLKITATLEWVYYKVIRFCVNNSIGVDNKSFGELFDLASQTEDLEVEDDSEIPRDFMIKENDE